MAPSAVKPASVQPELPAPVLIVTAPAPVGGLESAVAALATGLVEAGQPVVVLQMLPPEGAEATAFQRLPAHGVEVITERHRARDYVGALACIRHLVRTRRPLVVHAHGPRADLLLALTGMARSRSVSTVHGFVYEGLRGAVSYRLHLACLRRFTRVIAVSAALERQLAPRLRSGRLRCVPNAVSVTTPFTRDEARQRLALPATAVVAGWVGRLSAEKNPLLFIEAMARVAPGIEAVIIGDGPLRSAAEARAVELGIGARCHFVGAITNAGALFRGLDLFVLSSDTEGTPMTVLEAFESGTPVVATAVGGVPALLGADAGWLVSAGDAAELAGAIERVVRDEATRLQRTAAARARIADQFSYPRWIAAHLSLYREVGGSPMPHSLHSISSGA